MSHIVVTCGSRIAPVVEHLHRKIVDREKPPNWTVEYVDSDDHAGTIERVLRREADGPLDRFVVFQDVDCLVPRAAYEEAQASIHPGLLGISQAANHIDSARCYAGPAFMVVWPTRWYGCGSPDPHPDAQHDVAQRISDEWDEDPVLWRPLSWNPAGPVWRAGPHRFGWDTTYEHGVFHAFCIRDGGDRVRAFVERCQQWLLT